MDRYVARGANYIMMLIKYPSFSLINTLKSMCFVIKTLFLYFNLAEDWVQTDLFLYFEFINV